MSISLRTALVTVLATLMLLPAGTVAQARTAPECANADLEATASNGRRIRAAVLCLHNRIRAQHELPRLRENRRLRTAAVRHSRDMVRDGYFEHTTPEGVTMVDRILRTRYVRRYGSWALGENLAWGTGSYGTPRGAVDAWMASPGHRANILARAYREMGVGIALGVPVSGDAGTTYTVDFGVRR